jgi:hypothetical protein
MSVKDQINGYLASQPEPKRGEMEGLHERILKVRPRCKLWFLDGTNEDGKVVSNPNIGYGTYTMQYADGSTREFYQIGLTATANGISVYIMGVDDKGFLAETFGNNLGKAGVTGYCIRFKKLSDINIDVLESAIRFGFESKS